MNKGLLLLLIRLRKDTMLFNPGMSKWLHNSYGLPLLNIMYGTWLLYVRESRQTELIRSGVMIIASPRILFSIFFRDFVYEHLLFKINCGCLKRGVFLYSSFKIMLCEQISLKYNVINTNHIFSQPYNNLLLSILSNFYSFYGNLSSVYISSWLTTVMFCFYFSFKYLF